MTSCCDPWQLNYTIFCWFCHLKCMFHGFFSHQKQRQVLHHSIFGNTSNNNCLTSSCQCGTELVAEKVWENPNGRQILVGWIGMNWSSLSSSACLVWTWLAGVRAMACTQIEQLIPAKRKDLCLNESDWGQDIKGITEPSKKAYVGVRGQYDPSQMG